MSEKSFFYLQKAEYFRKIAQISDDSSENSTEEFELVPIEQERNFLPDKNIKPCCKRYYDPINKHYYNTDRMFNPNMDGIVQVGKKDPDIWYPENKLSFKTVRDTNGKYYRISKVYDLDGIYSYQYNPLNNLVVKNSGTNYYQPSVKKYSKYA